MTTELWQLKRSAQSAVRHVGRGFGGDAFSLQMFKIVVD